jgi:hypothetical protein
VPAVPLRALVLACAAALALVVCAPAAAQTPTIPQNGQGLSDAPPGLADDSGSSGSNGSSGSGAGGESGSGSSSGSRGSSDSASARRARDLPQTGADPRLVLLCGMALTLIGVGLRLRTADAERP